MLEDMLALANSVSLLALSSGMFERESAAQHGTARHSTAQHGTVPHRTAGHDTARHHTALRCAVDLDKLSRANVLFYDTIFYARSTYIPWYLVLSYDAWYARSTAQHGRALHRRAAHATARRYAALLT